MKRLTISIRKISTGDPELILRDGYESQVYIRAYDIGLHGCVVIDGVPATACNFTTVAVETSQCELLLSEILGPLDFSRSAMKVAA